MGQSESETWRNESKGRRERRTSEKRSSAQERRVGGGDVSGCGSEVDVGKGSKSLVVGREGV